MTYSVRRADLNRDRSLLLETLDKHLGVQNGAARFDWLYLQGVYGEARAFLLDDEAQGAVAGVAALFPRQFRDNGNTLSGCVFGDFCLAPASRSLGPGLQLQRACLEELANGSLEAAYDFPSAGMQAIYRRLGHTPQAEMVRLARPLRVDRIVREHVSFAPLSAALAGIGNRVLQGKDVLARKTSKLSASMYDGEIGEEFADLANGLSAGPGLCVYRTAAYLRWRFCQHPCRRYRFITCRRGERLVAYLVFSAEADQIRIADICGEVDAASMAALVSAAVKVGRTFKSEALSVSLLKGHPWTESLKDLGFYERESRPVLLWATNRGASEKQWFLTDGDRES
jgi:hypothetical protein